MTITEEQKTETIMTAAAEIAAKLDMAPLDDITDSYSGQTILIATAEGIQMGTVKARFGKIRTHAYTIYTLNGEKLFEERFARTVHGWEEEATIHKTVDESAIIYGE